MMLLPLHFIAQTPNDEDCGTVISGDPDPVGVYSYSDDPEYLDSFEPRIYNIFFWHVKKDDGTGSPTLSYEDYLAAVEKLNEAYNPYKICFNFLGYDYIYNSTYYNIALNPNNFPNEDPPPSTWSALKSFAKSNNNQYYKVNAFNVYNFRTLDFAGIANYMRNQVGVGGWQLKTDEKQVTLIHEIGHAFNLIHTHGPNEVEWYGSTCERVTRNPLDPNYNASGANAKGDKVHDTAAVPNFRREHFQYIYQALVDAGFPTEVAEYLAINGFAGHVNYMQIYDALFDAEFTHQEILDIAENGFTDYRYINKNDCTYIDDRGKDCGGDNYEIFESDIRNYMAYSYRPCSDSFTIGQAIRMHEAIEYDLPYGEFAAAETGISYNLYIKDLQNDIGQEPNIHADIFWNSPDIWVRNQQDGISSQKHQNPEYDPVNPNYIYVKIRNKSCGTSSGNDILKVYWSKSTVGYSWPYHWDGSWVVNGIDMGGELTIAIPNIPSILPGGEAIMEIPWMVPDPDDYIGISSNPWHFSLLARIESTEDPMAYTEGNYTAVNVKNNNNIAWKNVNVVDLVPNVSTPIGSVIALSNPTNQAKTYNLSFFKDPGEAGKPIYQEAEVGITLDSTLVAAWNSGGSLGSNYALANATGNKLVATGDSMELSNIELQAYEYATMYVTFNFLTAELTSKNKFVYHITQKDETSGEVYGGETFIINKLPRMAFSAYGGEDEFIKMNDEITLYAESINEDALYNWYDPDGNLIYTGADLTVSPLITQTYKLEIIAETDGYKDYDEVTVNIMPYHIESLIPNPVNSQLTVTYDAQGATSAYLMLVNQTTSNSDNYILDTEESSIGIDVSGLPTGLYSVILVCNGEIQSVKNLVKQ